MKKTLLCNLCTNNIIVTQFCLVSWNIYCETKISSSVNTKELLKVNQNILEKNKLSDSLGRIVTMNLQGYMVGFSWTCTHLLNTNLDSYGYRHNRLWLLESLLGLYKNKEYVCYPAFTLSNQSRPRHNQSYFQYINGFQSSKIVCSYFNFLLNAYYRYATKFSQRLVDLIINIRVEECYQFSFFRGNWLGFEEEPRNYQLLLWKFNVTDNNA